MIGDVESGIPGRDRLYRGNSPGRFLRVGKGMREERRRNLDAIGCMACVHCKGDDARERMFGRGP